MTGLTYTKIYVFVAMLNLLKAGRVPSISIKLADMGKIAGSYISLYEMPMVFTYFLCSTQKNLVR